MRDLPNRTLSSEVGAQWVWPVTLGSVLKVSRTLDGRLRPRKFSARQVLGLGSGQARSIPIPVPELRPRVPRREVRSEVRMGDEH